MKPIIEVRNISKEYRLGGSRRHNDSFREVLLSKFRRPLEILTGTPANRKHDEHFWALRDVSFDVQQGEVVGIIGRNGAGKSTLLKILSRITDPSSGSISLRGRLASLLEVGTGFHPELTGRENIFLNGAILGMRKAEIKARFDEIVAFSEIEKFLDTPVKHYSSGMYVRLAFAVAAHLNPEVLIVDEVLAVGDMAFQKKCLGKMSEVSRGGRTVLFVSHNMAAVESLCQRGIVLEQGQMVFNGTAKEAVEQYLAIAQSGAAGPQAHTVDLTEAPRRSRLSSGRLLSKLEFVTDGDQPLTGGLPLGDGLKIRVHFTLQNPTEGFDVGLGFNNVYGQRVFTAHSWFEPDRPHGSHVGPQIFVCDIPSFTLLPGDYTLRVWLDVGRAEADLVDDAARITVLPTDYYGTGKVPWNGVFVLKHDWYLDKDATPVATKLKYQSSFS
jgi:homopolymeric O-antigen transport system ATP-binding protein